VTDLTVGSELLLRPIAPGFLGLSTENYALEAYAGRNPNAINPVFLQLVRGLAPRTPPVLRIGGGSADLAWIPTPGLRRPLGTRITLGRRLMDVLTATTRDLDARLILDLNLEADEPRLTAYEAATLVRRVGASHVLALELGNEPELYGLLPWGPTRRPGRPRGYTIGDYEREFDRFGALLPRLPLAGPSTAFADDVRIAPSGVAQREPSANNRKPGCWPRNWRTGGVRRTRGARPAFVLAGHQGHDVVAACVRERPRGP
jgi:hypothetical protein